MPSDTLKSGKTCADGANSGAKISLRPVKVSKAVAGKTVVYAIADPDTTNAIGVLAVHEHGDVLFIDDILGPGQKKLGFRAVREIVRQLALHHSGCEHMEGVRLTGHAFHFGARRGFSTLRLKFRAE